MAITSERRLLVLDDDPLVGMLVETIARFSGLGTWLTGDPSTFFDAVREFQPDCIFLDLTMPLMTGEEVLRRLAQQMCAARIIISSGAEPDRLSDAAALATRSGLVVAGTLLKPFAAAELRSLLAQP